MASNRLYTYVYFEIKDHANRPSLSAYTLDITPLIFVPNFTTASLLSSTQYLSNKYLLWDFGDGTTSSNLTATHVYKAPGNYNVKLTVFDNYGNTYFNLYQPTVNIFNFVEDDLNFENYGKFIYDVPASKIIDPLRILRHNSYQIYNTLSSNYFTVNLYASGALGSYIDLNAYLNDKWSHLRSLSRFYKKEKIGDVESYTIVTSVSTIDTNIYAKINDNGDIARCQAEDEGSVFAGTTGYADIYYVDDRTKNFTTRESPIFVFSTIENREFNDAYSYKNELFKYIPYPPEGFQNLQTAVQPIIKVRHNPAAKLSITSNGIDGEGTLSASNFNIPKISWQNTEIPFVVKLKDVDGFTTRTYPPLYCSKIEPQYASLSTFNVSLDLVTNNTTRISDVTFYSDFSEDIPRSIGAFYKGYFIPNTSNLNCKLTAGMNVIDPVNYPKDSLLGWICEPDYRFLKRIFRTSIFDYCEGTVTFNLSGKVDDFKTPNSPNSYCVAVAPSGAKFGNDYQAWVGDGTVDRIYKIDVYGNILSSYNLSSFPVSGIAGITYRDLRSQDLSSAAPNSIALDGNSDAWVALFDSVSCIKLSYDNAAIKALAYPNAVNISYYLSSTYTLPELSGFAGENSLLPASIDTDYDNNLWVAYTHPVSNFLVKYNTLGTILTAVPFPTLVSPVEIVVDRNKFVWLTALNNNISTPDIDQRNDFVYKFNSDGILVSGFPLSGFKLVGNITVDGNQNAYVAHNRETLTKIDGINNNITNIIAGSGANKTNYICSIGGIAGDTGEYIWVINNFDYKLYYIDLLAPTQTISASTYLDLIFPTEPDPGNPVSAFSTLEFQAYGDWNGSRWINKYMVPYTVTRYLTGESSVFDVNSDHGVYNIQKQNENFNAEEFYSDLRYQEILIDRDIFFKEFLGTIVGDLSSQPYELGKTIYEKIANFSSNLSDVSKCNLDQLLSFCYELGVQFEQYNYPFPPQLKRIVDILSIKHKQLYGELNKYKYDFNKRFTTNPDIGRNLGNKISPVSGIITQSTPIVAYEKFSNLYKLVNTFNLLSTVPLSTYNYNWGWGLVAPKSISGVKISNYYDFYEYINIVEGSVYNNVIDFNNPLNTLSPYSSSYKEWSKKDGIMQNALSYELTKGLKLFLSAANIQYNN